MFYYIGYGDNIIYALKKDNELFETNLKEVSESEYIDILNNQDIFVCEDYKIGEEILYDE